MAEATKFRDMPYERPDAEGTKQAIAALAERLAAATSYDEARAVFMEKELLEKRIDTLQNLSYIRHSIDTRDAFYNAENDFWDEFTPELEEPRQAWTLAMLKSPFRPQFEEEFGTLMFRNAEISARSFSPEIIPEMQAEGKLTTEYGKLIASAQIPFDGGTYTLSQLSPFKTDADDAVRLAAWKAEGAWYKEHQADLDRIYDELVHLRDTMGKKLGHDGYIPLGYDRMERNCYDKGDVEAFRASVRRLFFWGWIMVAIFTVIYAVGGMPLVHFMTTEQSVLQVIGSYFTWVLLIPVCGMAAFVYDGVFIGITATRGMLVSSVTAALLFFALFFIGRALQLPANHLLWAVYLIYLLARGVMQFGWMKLVLPAKLIKG